MTPPRRAAFLPSLLAVLLAGAASAADVQPPAVNHPASAAVAQSARPSVSSKEAIRPAPVRTAPAPRPESQPAWTELTPQQQQSLAPLATTWRTLGEAHKRKWLALSENFHSMPPPEQARLHSRMAEWAVLSPQQRNTARLNFAEAQKVAPDDKRAKWEAYQALSPEEKKRLAAAAKPAPPPTAIAVQPVPRDKLARIPPKAKKGEVVPSQPVIVPGPAEDNAALPPPVPPAQP